ncbi:STAS domain-containing protein [Ruminococcus sp.]|uniref:STAS domain-containing protein n=1 Tax=Ruminococcus sp. TaxID=41978 RepID=UPI002E7A660D|nr:STAS domain-containing protein [Ruminococcus sp.]MEE1261454.1 STAS domain-containing protein [Ruminococcus sp.]
MNLTVTSENKVYTIAITGRIDTLTAPELESKFREIEKNAEKLIFDMREVEYISSAGMRVIVAAHRAMLPKDGLVLRGLTKNVRTIINLTGFNNILNIEE